jgi:hypothetical protein
MNVQCMEDPGRLETELLRALSPATKIAVMNGLIRQAYALKEAWVRASEPDLSDDAVRARVRELVAGGNP